MDQFKIIVSNLYKYSTKLHVVFILILIHTGCTKKRISELPENLNQQIFAITEFKDLTVNENSYNITTDTKYYEFNQNQATPISKSLQFVSIQSSNLPGKMKTALNNLIIPGKNNTNYPLVFLVEDKYLTAFKVIKNKNEIHPYESQIALTFEEFRKRTQMDRTSQSQGNNAKIDSGQYLYIPLFQFKIISFGRLIPTKNELKENTSVLELKQTEWKDATHVQLNLNSSERLNIELLKNKFNKDFENLHDLNDIHNHVYSALEIENIFKYKLDINNEQKIQVVASDNNIYLYKILNLKFALLSENEKVKLKSNTSFELRSCDNVALKDLKENEKEFCYLRLAAALPFQFVKLSRDQLDLNGTESNELKIEIANSKNQSSLIRVQEYDSNNEMIVEEQNQSKLILQINDIQNKEFYLRRTLEDITTAMNENLTNLSPGHSSPILLVKFEIQNDRLVVVKSDNPNFTKDRQSELDNEEILSFPVKFLKYKQNSKYKNSYIPASKIEAEFVEVDLNNDLYQDTQSVLNYIQMQNCFSNINHQSTQDVDNRIKQGLLNLSRVINLDVNENCLDNSILQTNQSIIKNRQSNVRIKERISLMINDHKLDTPHIEQLPRDVRRQLNIGSFTLVRKFKDRFGRFDEELERNLTLAPDFRHGKVMKYYILGLPENGETRDMILLNIKKVFADWNSAYHKIFEDTEYKRTGDYLSFQVAEQLDHNVHLGDLDVNIIQINMKHRNGLFGVSSAGYNPRSGIVIADIINIYVGEIISNLKNHWMIYDKQFSLAIEIQNRQKTNKIEISKIGDQLITNQIQNATEFKIPDIKKAETVKFIVSNLITNKAKENYRLSDRVSEQPLDYSGIFKYVKEKMKNNAASDSIYFNSILRLSNITDLNNLKGQINPKLYQLSSLKSQNNDCFYFNGNLNLIFSLEGKKRFETVNDLIDLQIQATLAHEIGHSQGLAHNFSSSFDKANMFNDKGENIGYSSVMDYVLPFDNTYSGIGSYDIYVLRALQTNRIELKNSSSNLITKIRRSDYEVKNNLFNFIALKKQIYPKLSNVNDWPSELTEFKSIVKKYHSCTDEYSQAYYCRKFDNGTSFVDMVKKDIQKFENLYLFNFGKHSQNKELISDEKKLLSVKQSLDLLVQIRSIILLLPYLGTFEKTEANDLLTAIKIAKDFFMSLAAGPNTMLLQIDKNTINFTSYQDRFQSLIFNSQSQSSFNLQLKSDKDIYISRTANQSQNYETIGNEINKLVAIQLLIDRGNTDRDSITQGLNTSFLDFEKYFENKIDLQQSDILKIIKNIIVNDLSPIVMTEDYKIKELTSIKQHVDLNFRQHVAMLSMLNLENVNQNLSLSDLSANIANLFKIRGRSYIIPKDQRPYIQIQNSAKVDSVRFWPITEKGIAEQLINKTLFIQFLNNKENTLLQNEIKNISSSILHLKLIQRGHIDGNQILSNNQTLFKVMNSQLITSKQKLINLLIGSADFKKIIQNLYSKNSTNIDQWINYFAAQAIQQLGTSIDLALNLGDNQISYSDVKNNIVKIENIKFNNPILNLMVETMKEILKTDLYHLKENNKINSLDINYQSIFSKNERLGDLISDNLALIDYLSRLTDYVSPYR